MHGLFASQQQQKVRATFCTRFESPKSRRTRRTSGELLAWAMRRNVVLLAAAVVFVVAGLLSFRSCRGAPVLCDDGHWAKPQGVI